MPNTTTTTTTPGQDPNTAPPIDTTVASDGSGGTVSGEKYVLIVTRSSSFHRHQQALLHHHHHQHYCIDSNNSGNDGSTDELRKRPHSTLSSDNDTSASSSATGTTEQSKRMKVSDDGINDFNEDDGEDDEDDAASGNRGGRGRSPSRGMDTVHYTSAPPVTEDRSSGSGAPPVRGPNSILFFRGLPHHCHEREIADVCKPYGMTKAVILSLSRQAFVEFESVEKATQFMHMHNGQCIIRGQTVHIAYSDKRELSHPDKVEPPNNILLVQVSEVLYPITTDVLYKVFSRFGPIEKIVIMNKGRQDVVKALVQYPSVEIASAAKEGLDGQNIYNNCCLLTIIYSKLKELTVHVNDDRTRDFTNPNLPTSSPAGPYGSSHAPYPVMPYMGGGAYHPTQMYGGAMPPQQDPSGAAAYGMYGAMGGYPPVPAYGASARGSPVVFVSGISEEVRCHDLFILFGVYGDVKAVKILPNRNSDKALVEYLDDKGADNALHYLRNGCPLFGSTISVSRSNHDSIIPPPSHSSDSNYANYANSPLHRYRSLRNKHSVHICEPSQFLHVANIDPSVSEAEIRSLFSNYGYVEEYHDLGLSRSTMRPETGSEKKMAIVKMDSLDNAIRALIELHDKEVHGRGIKVTFSSRGNRS